MDQQNETGSSWAVWDSVSASYDTKRVNDRIYTACVRRTVDEVIRASGGTALDIGCGTGLTTLPLLEHFDRVVGMDYSAESLRRLRAKTSASHLTLVRGDLLCLPFADNAFDAVLCANVLQHVRPGEPQKRAAAEIMRTAKPGARIVISVHHYSRAKQRARWVKEGKPGDPEIDYIYRFTFEELRRLFIGSAIVAAGFAFAGPLTRIEGLVPRAVIYPLSAIGARLGFGHMLIATFRKRA